MRTAVRLLRTRPRAEVPPAVMLMADDGRRLPLEASRWHGSPTPVEQNLLSGLEGPVLDVGCGPGRIVEGLARRGIAALGVDHAPTAVALARRRGCAVLQRSVFRPLPGEGRWASVMLLDGNLGIGGDPMRLLRRCRGLARQDGVIIAEVEPPGWGWLTCRARVERGHLAGPWFAWSVVGADAIAEVAGCAGLKVRTLVPSDDGRWFAHLAAEVGTRCP